MSDNNKINKTDKLFRDALSNKEVLPPAPVWENIEKQVLLEEKEKDRRRIIYLTWWAAAASLLLIIITGTWIWNKTDNRLTPNNNNSTTVLNESSSTNDSKENTPAKADEENRSLISEKDLVIDDTRTIEEKNNVNVPEQKLTAEKKPVGSLENTNTAKKKKPHNEEIPIGTNSIANAKEKNSENKIKQKPNSENTSKQENNFSTDSPKTNDIAVTTNNSEKQTIQKTIDDITSSKNQAPKINDQTIKSSDINATEKSVPITNLLVTFNPLQASLPGIMDTSKKINVDQLAIVRPLLSKENKWCLGATFSPDYTYQVFKSKNTKEAQDVYINNSQPRYTFSYGLHGGYKLNKNWSLQTGIYYADRGEKTIIAIIDSTPSGVIIFNATGIGPSAVNVNNNNAIVTQNDKEVLYSYKYIDVPLILKYRLGEKKLAFTSSTGLLFNFFLNYSATVAGNNNSTTYLENTDKSGFRKVGYSVMISAGADYKITNRISISGEPTFRYSLTTLSSNTSLKSYPYSLGLATSLRYFF